LGIGLTQLSAQSSQNEEYPVPRIAVHANPVGYFMFGPVVSLEAGLTKHLVLNGHVRFSSIGKMTKETIYTDEEDIPDELTGIAFGGGPLYFFGKRLSKPYAGILFEYDKADVKYATIEDWAWQQNDKSMLFMVNAGYRLRFKFGLFINAGIYGGVAKVKSHWDYIDIPYGSDDPSPRDQDLTKPYIQADISVGFGF
jgi:hypothetical protein